MGDILVFRHAFLIDGTGAEPQENATVVVADGRTRWPTRAFSSMAIPPCGWC